MGDPPLLTVVNTPSRPPYAPYAGPPSTHEDTPAMTAAAVIPNTTTLARLPSSAPRPGHVLFRVLSAALVARPEDQWIPAGLITDPIPVRCCREVLVCEGHPITSWCPGNP